MTLTLAMHRQKVVLAVRTQKMWCKVHKLEGRDLNPDAIVHDKHDLVKGVLEHHACIALQLYKREEASHNLMDWTGSVMNPFKMTACCAPSYGHCPANALGLRLNYTAF
jgi:hypothetical protein